MITLPMSLIVLKIIVCHYMLHIDFLIYFSRVESNPFIIKLKYVINKESLLDTGTGPQTDHPHQQNFCLKMFSFAS